MRGGLPSACAPRCPNSGLRYFAGQDNGPFITDISLTARRANKPESPPPEPRWPSERRAISGWDLTNTETYQL
jgi:hypothetical protein